MRKNTEIYNEFKKAIEEKDNNIVSIILMEVMLDIRACLIGIKKGDRD
jgi:hypothetical protein